MDPERITRGVISLTIGDSRRGSLGSIFRFLGLCVCLGVQRGLSRVLIKYSGNVRLQYTNNQTTGPEKRPNANLQCNVMIEPRETY